MFTEWTTRGKPTVLGAASGAVAGLVAITPASGYVGPVSSIVIGGLAGVLCYAACNVKSRLGYDDSLDVVGVHAVAGGGAHDIQTGQVQAGNPRRFLPLAELFEDPVFGVGCHHDCDRDPVVRRGPQRSDRVMHGTVAHQRDDGTIRGGELSTNSRR